MSQNPSSDDDRPAYVDGGLRQAMAEAMHDAVCNCLDRGFGYHLRSRDLDALTAALVPVVEQQLVTAQAEALRDAASKAQRHGIRHHVVVSEWLFALAGEVEYQHQRKLRTRRWRATRA